MTQLGHGGEMAPSRRSMKYTLGLGKPLNWLPLETDRDEFVYAAGFAVCGLG
jgi:hypothetical protein